GSPVARPAFPLARPSPIRTLFRILSTNPMARLLWLGPVFETRPLLPQYAPFTHRCATAPGASGARGRCPEKNHRVKDEPDPPLARRRLPEKATLRASVLRSLCTQSNIAGTHRSRPERDPQQSRTTRRPHALVMLR